MAQSLYLKSRHKAIADIQPKKKEKKVSNITEEVKQLRRILKKLEDKCPKPKKNNHK